MSLVGSEFGDRDVVLHVGFRLIRQDRAEHPPTWCARPPPLPPARLEGTPVDDRSTPEHRRGGRLQNVAHITHARRALCAASADSITGEQGYDRRPPERAASLLAPMPQKGRRGLA
ncbi:hypothetical protein MMAD_02180 [Mycolicibacterium madagascariense]|uniref:Uncharacterized protein n=1 Tax=Mycolicibacterium madagascariense TaxID=212765 RepID=A0A7I7XAG7_9MYCO|nr:hypothetical protein MMAD_02180 [Mycolicibacterium madagascariense]